MGRKDLKCSTILRWIWTLSDEVKYQVIEVGERAKYLPIAWSIVWCCRSTNLNLEWGWELFTTEGGTWQHRCQEGRKQKAENSNEYHQFLCMHHRVSFYWEAWPFGNVLWQVHTWLHPTSIPLSYFLHPSLPHSHYCCSHSFLFNHAPSFLVHCLSDSVRSPQTPSNTEPFSLIASWLYGIQGLDIAVQFAFSCFLFFFLDSIWRVTWLKLTQLVLLLLVHFVEMVGMRVQFLGHYLY